jgi:DNA-binding GntR family transcriptional regulator
MNHVIDPMLRPLTRWAEHSQRRACRNAMAASTALAERRRERDQVQEFIDELIARRTPRAAAALPAHTAAQPG